MRTLDGFLPDLLESLDRDGYAIAESVLEPEEVAAVRADLDPLLVDLPKGRNPFEGLVSQRIYALLAKTRAMDAAILHPVILELAQTLLGPFQLSALVAIAIGPGEPAQSEHHDDGVYPLPRGHQDLVLSTMWALEDFTEENGATVLLPGSHRWTTEHPSPTSERRQAVMPAGSLLLYRGAIWHGGGENRSARSRLGITIEYLAGWLRPQENHVAALDPALVASLPDRLQELLGYNIYPPFVGYVDGRDPRRLLAEGRLPIRA
jgi:ectoine hydroxylase-related dioxygenase (phytanoyl-CoA dioxygenase family)